MAENLGITIEFKGETVELDNSINSLNALIKATRKDITGLNKELKFDSHNVDILKQKFADIQTQIAANEEKARFFTKSIDDLGVVTTNNARQWIAYNGHLTETNHEISRLKNQAEELQKYINNIDTYKSIENLKALGSEFKTVGNLATELGNAFKGISTLAGGALTGAVNEAKNFESAFAGVMKTVDETSTTTYGDLRESILQMTRVLPSTSSEIANVMEMAGQLGVRADDIEKFSKVMIDLGNSTNINATEGAASLAQFYNIMGSNLSTVDRFGAALTALGNNAATTEADILNMAQNLASAGKTIGLTEQEVLGISTALASTGLTAEKAGSAISTILSKIAVEVDSGGKKLEAWADVAGMSVESFKELWGNKTTEAIKAIIKGLSESEERGTSLNATLSDLEINNIRQADTLRRLANSYENFDFYLEMANSEWQKNTALTEEAARRYSTTESQMQIFKNSISEMAIALGNNLLPAINSFLDSVKPVLYSLTTWVGQNASLITSFLALVGSISPVLLAFGKISTGIGNVAMTLANLKASGLVASETITALSGVIGTAMPVALGVGVVGLGLLAIALKDTANEANQAKAAFESSYNTFNEQSEKGNESFKKSEVQLIKSTASVNNYVSQLDLLNQKLSDTTLSEEDRTATELKAQELIEKINQGLGDEVFAWSEVDSAILLNGEKVDDLKIKYDELIEKMRAQAWLEAFKEQYQESFKVIDEWDRVNEAATSAYAERLEGISYDTLPTTDEAVKQLTDRLKQQGDLGEYQATRLKYAYRDYKKTIGEIPEEVNNAMLFQEEYERVAVDGLQNVQKNYGSTREEIKKTIEELFNEKAAVEGQIKTLEEKGEVVSKAMYDHLDAINKELAAAIKASIDIKSAQADEEREIKESNSRILANSETTWTGVKNVATNSINGIPDVKTIRLALDTSAVDNYSPGFGKTNVYTGRSNQLRSGGIGLNMNIHINNNGSPIDQQEINRWTDIMVSRLDSALGRRI